MCDSKQGHQAYKEQEHQQKKQRKNEWKYVGLQSAHYHVTKLEIIPSSDFNDAFK